MKELMTCKATAGFGNYFQMHYATNVKQWAACYRKDAFVNTNMYVEACIHERNGQQKTGEMHPCAAKVGER